MVVFISLKSFVLPTLEDFRLPPYGYPIGGFRVTTPGSNWMTPGKSNCNIGKINQICQSGPEDFRLCFAVTAFICQAGV
jgi:hypothetical protein